MEESILNTIKQMIGLDISDRSFDPQVIAQINTAIATLSQIGVTKNEGFTSVTDENQTWDDYCSISDAVDLIKTYLYRKVQLYFDPPQSSTLIELSNNQLSELEFRINAIVDIGME